MIACGPLLAPARAEAPFPPQVQTGLDSLSAALATIQRDATELTAAAAALRAQVEADPSLAGPLGEQLQSMLDLSRTRATPELDAFLLPYLLMHALPSEPGALHFSRDSLQVLSANGERNDEVFLVRPDFGAAQPHRFRLAWRDVPASETLTLKVALEEGVHFTLVENDCPARLPPSGTCNLAVAFDIAGNGVRADAIVATFGPITEYMRLNGQGIGFPAAYPQVIAPGSTTVRLDAAAGGGENRVTFHIVNTGAGVLPPFVPRLWSREGRSPEFWKLDRSSSCLTTQTLPGERCTIVLSFEPTRNGSGTALFAVPDPRGTAYDHLHGEVFGYIRGFVEDLPPGLLTNGDPCPASGASAEVVTKRGPVGPRNDDLIHLDTLACDAWVAEGDARVCSDPGSIEGGTARYRTRSSPAKPWRLTSLSPARVWLTCHHGAIERIGGR